MTPMQILALTEADTLAVASRLADDARKGDIFLLEGDLGAGKTAFSRAFIRSLTGDPEQEVPSPTFTLLQTYGTPRGEIWHFDLYRLKDPDEIFELGWEDALAEGILLIEWPDRLGPHRPARCITVRLDPVAGQPSARSITLTDERAG